MPSFGRISLFNTTLEEMVRGAIEPPPTFFSDMFSRGGVVVDKEVDTVSMDSIFRSLGVSPLVMRGGHGEEENTEKHIGERWEANEILFPLFHKDVVVPDHLTMKKMAGERLGDNQLTRETRRMVYLSELTGVVTYEHLIGREVMFAACMASGEIVAPNGIIDYKRNADLKGKTASVVWSDTSNAVPLQDIGSIFKGIRISGGASRSSMVLLMGDSAWTHLSNWIMVQPPQTDIRNHIINTGYGVPVPPEDLAWMTESGVDYKGYLISSYVTKPVYLFTYPDTYDTVTSDGDPIEKGIPFIAPNDALGFIYNTAATKVYYGPGKHTPGVLNDLVYAEYEALFSSGILDSIQTDGGFAQGTTGSILPEGALSLLMYQLTLKGDGVGVSVSLAPLPILKHPNIGAQIDTNSTAAPINDVFPLITP